MRKIIILQFCLLMYFNCFSQLSASFEKDTLVFERDAQIDYIIHLPVSIKGLNAGAVANTIGFVINSSGTTMTASDYLFTTLQATINAGVREIDCPVTILHGENGGGGALFISIQMSYNNSAIQVKSVVLKIKNKEKEEKKNKLEIGAISIGHSFDFFGKDNALISYADAYIFGPNTMCIGKNAEEKKYGFAVKLYQNKSVTVDSLNTSGNLYKFVYQTLVNPLQPPINDSIFLKQEILNRKTSYKSNNWGMYIRMFRDISYTTNDKTKFYFGLHGEFLRRDIVTTYEYQSEKDTVLKVKSNQIPYTGNKPVGRNTIVSEFYVAPYIEFVHQNDDINVRFSVIPAGLNVYRSTTLDNITFSKMFFMGQFDLIINKINVKLGAECRGIYSVKSQPYWNVFISKSLSWAKLTELIF